MRVELPRVLARFLGRDKVPSVRFVIDYDPKAVAARKNQYREQKTLLQILSPEKAFALLRQQLSGRLSASVGDEAGQEGISDSSESMGDYRHYHRREPRPTIYESPDTIEDFFSEQSLRERFGKHGKLRH